MVTFSLRIACSRLSDSRGRATVSERKKNQGVVRAVTAFLAFVSPSFTSLARFSARPRLSESLEQATLRRTIILENDSYRYPENKI